MERNLQKIKWDLHNYKSKKLEKINKKVLQFCQLCYIIQIVKFLQINLYLGG